RPLTRGQAEDDCPVRQPQQEQSRQLEQQQGDAVGVVPRVSLSARNAARPIEPRAAEAMKHGAACSWPPGAAGWANIKMPCPLW
ncbi:MAG: hypothetical protein JW953_02300, partial [Anaerolineae bacterium]|nr:hypothetical protein [Anaerolineae bacterium]